MFNEYGHFTGTIPDEAIQDCTQPGMDADPMVKFWRERLNFEVPRQQAIDYLREFGAWTVDELEEKTDEEIAEVVLWIACGDLKHEGEWFGLTH